MPNEITMEHVRKAAEWAKTAKTANEPTQIDGCTRRYDQSEWDCGTACCMWGAASILAGNGPADSGPPSEWGKDARHKLVMALLNSCYTTPEQVIEAIDNANIRGADLSGANLSDANLSDANLRGADLSGANLSGANLIGANLSGAYLSGANLSDANLRGAYLSGADLSGANLSGANLSDANLSDANLRGANLRGANLRGADLSGAKIRIGNVYRTLK